MTRYLVPLCGAIALTVSIGAASDPANARSAPPPTRLLVKADDPARVAMVEASVMRVIGQTLATSSIASANAARVVPSPELARIGYIVVQLPDDQSTAITQALAPIPYAIHYTPGVAAVYGDGTKYAYDGGGPTMSALDSYPIDPMVNAQWVHAKIGSADAWNAGYMGAGVVIAILDTGVECAHADLRCTSNGHDFTGGDAPTDRIGHGTHVAGTAAALGGNGQGGSGVAPLASIMAVKVLADDGFGADSWIASGIVYAVDNGADVLNLSLGSDDPAPILDDALRYATERGALVTCAAGNSGTDAPSYPNTYAGCLGVAATRKDGETGTSWTNWGVNADVGIGGEAIMSTYTNGRYAQMDGTSMAAPALAGVLALAIGAGVPPGNALAVVNGTGVPLTGRLAGLRRPNLTTLSAYLDARQADTEVPTATASRTATRTATRRPTATPTRTPTRTRTPGVVPSATATFRAPTLTAVRTATPPVPALGWPCVVVMVSNGSVTIRCPVAATARP